MKLLEKKCMICGQPMPDRVCPDCGKVRFQTLNVGFAHRNAAKFFIHSATLCVTENRCVLSAFTDSDAPIGLAAAIAAKASPNDGSRVFDSKSVQMTAVTYPLDKKYGPRLNSIAPNRGVRVTYSNGDDLLLRFSSVQAAQEARDALQAFMANH